MKFVSRNRYLLWSLALASVVIATPSQTVQFPDGRVAFESGISLVDAYTTFSGVRIRQARYYFDLELPQDLGEPLEKLVIRQRGGSDRIEFRPDRTRAYLGDHDDKGEPLAVTSSFDEATAEIEVRFDRPIPPGSKVTVGIKPKRNPDYAGVYLFGVTAFPPGEKPIGMYLGPGRLHFYRGSDFRY